MDRNKVLELAREAEILRQLSMEVPFVVDRLEQFAALIEREVRGDAEPVAYIGTDGNLGWLKKPEALYSKPVPLFKHPAPAVVRQLVEALEQLMSIVKIHSRATSNNFAWAEMDFAKEALAAVKGADV